MLHNTPKDRRSHLHRGVSLQQGDYLAWRCSNLDRQIRKRKR